MENLLGKRLRALREERHLTQLELAKYLKISNTALSQYEVGNRTPSDELKLQIAQFFDISLDFLFGRTEIRNSSNDYDMPQNIKNLLRDAYKLTPEQLDAIQRLVDQFVNEKK